MPKIPFPPEFVDELKREFSADSCYEGYDADEDPGYFVEFILGKLYELRKQVDGNL